MSRNLRRVHGPVRCPSTAASGSVNAIVEIAAMRGCFGPGQTKRMASMLGRVKQEARNTLVGLAERHGYELRKRHFYTPLPDVSELPEAMWSTPSPMRGVTLDLDAAVAFLRSLAPYIEEFGQTPYLADFPLENRNYGPGDAEVLYAVIRQTRPRRVFEFGSGYSSHVIGAANRRASDDGHGFDHRVFDPYPWQQTSLGPVSSAHLRPIGAAQIPLSEFDVLASGDILFIDTTHTVKTGGDVTRIVLDALPRLASGVFVHFHDIFLPFEYPREWVVDMRRAWAEQYLLQAFLMFNDDFRAVIPLHALARSRRDDLASVVPSIGTDAQPGAFWLARTSVSS